MKNKKQTSLIGSIIACAILFALLSGYGSISLGPKEFTRQLGAAVGASAGVAANEYNTLAQALSQKESEIGQREASLVEREAAVLAEASEKDTKLVFLILSVGILLLCLILLNFYLDWRGRQIKK
jgi:hypothetical protein